MKTKQKTMLASLFLFILLLLVLLNGQLETVDKDDCEGTNNSQLEVLAHKLMDGVGPRLVG